MKTIKILYWISTGLLTLLMLFSVQMYLFNHDAIATAFTGLGFPTWLIYPLATLKVLGLIAIWTKQSSFLKEWAYVGFFFDVVMAFTAHSMADDGGGMFAAAGILFVITSYVSDGKIYGNAAFNPTS